jgi:hypothetical protein
MRHISTAPGSQEMGYIGTAEY